MKKRLISTMLLFGAALMVSAQTVPTHPRYVTDVDGGKAFIDYFSEWEPGTPISVDENFYISRVKPKERFVNANTQVNPSLTTDRKFCWWSPLGIPGNKTWGPLTRYTFNADNFAMWQYLDIHGGWGVPWVRVPGSYSDVAHKNGVLNGCMLFFDMGTGASKAQPIIDMLVEKNEAGTEFKNSRKLIRFMRYYGVDGLGINPEAAIKQAALFQDFLAECHNLAKEEEWHFNIYWYGSMTNTGGVNLGSTFGATKQDWLSKKGSKVSDMYMMNYGWSQSGLLSSGNLATQLGRSPADLYAGFDTQGKWLKNPWTALQQVPVSIVMWGAHDANMVYSHSTELGSGDLAVQTTYSIKQEQFFSGGNRNPASRPVLDGSIGSATINAMKKFHGIAEFYPARSTMQELPFVTRFGLGNGYVFRSEGKVTFNQKWYNLGTQDYLPTWRWWITNDAGNVPTDAVDCSFTFDDSWFAGSCLKLSGATEKSNIRMFKTNFNVSANDEIALRYKVKNGKTSHLKLFWSKVGSENDFQSVDIPAATNFGEWTLYKVKASDISIAGNVACIGFSVENTQPDYEILLGEFSIVNDNRTWAPALPKITHAEVMARYYNTFDCKIIFQSKANDAAKPYQPIYNEDVETWYFEILTQAKGEQEVLCTTTTSWAAYVVGAPTTETVSEYRVGVRAVAPDGKTRSGIVWSDWMNQEKVTIKEDIEIDKSVIKADEKFTIRLIDPLHDAAQYWEIIDPVTGTSITMDGFGEKSFTTSISKEGIYDVKMVRDDMSELIIRGLVQISPKEVGALPILGEVTADKTTAETNENISINYQVARLGEGKVSRGLDIHDPNMFRIPAQILPKNSKSYSIGLWFKVDKFSHAVYGTNLINKRYLGNGWPHNNNGEIFVHIWPGKTNQQNIKVLNDNVVAYNIYNNKVPALDGNGNLHQVPNLDCTGINHSLSEDVWNHALVVLDGGTQLRLYINGELVATDNTVTHANYSNSDKAPIFIGGSNVNHAGLSGTIDEVQVWNKALTQSEVSDAMKGYAGRTIPEELLGYWDFEELESDGESFKSKGKLSDLNGHFICFQGASGESTATAAEVILTPNNNVTGNPAITGTLDIKTTAEYALSGASYTVQEDGSALAAYKNEGVYDVTITLKNMWGEDKITKNDFISVSDLSGLDENVIQSFNFYPNPFKEQANILFNDEGKFTIEIYATNGTLVKKQVEDVITGQVVNISLNSASGLYLVRINKNGVCVRSFKINKL